MLMVVNRLNIALIIILMVEGMVGIVMRLVAFGIFVTLVVIVLRIVRSLRRILVLIWSLVSAVLRRVMTMVPRLIHTMLSGHAIFSILESVVNSMLMVVNRLNIALIIVLMVELVVSIMMGLVAVSFFMMITVVMFSLVRACVGLIRSGLMLV